MGREREVEDSVLVGGGELRVKIGEFREVFAVMDA